MWHLPQFSKRLELLIKPSGFGYNAYNQAIVVKIPNQVIPYLTEYYYISFVDIEGTALCFSFKKFLPGTNEVEYYVKIESIDGINHTSLFIYYDSIDPYYNYEYASWNPLDKHEDLFLSNSNLKATQTKSFAHSNVRATISRSSGKWYWEIYINDSSTGSDVFVGVASPQHNLALELGNAADYSLGYKANGKIYPGNSAYGDSYSSGNTIGVAIDLNAGKIWWSKNGVWQAGGNPEDGTNEAFSGVSGDLYPAVSMYGSNRAVTARFNPKDITYSTPTNFNCGFYKNKNESIECVFDGAYIINFLGTTSLTSEIGPDFSNHGAALHQPICNTHAAKTSTATAYVSCNISKSSFTLFFNCYLISGQGYLVYFSSSNYVYIDVDGSLIAKINGIEHAVGAKLYFDVCSTFSITCDGENTYVIINGLTKLTIKQTFSISEIRLGGNGSSGYSVEGYFFDLFLLPSKLPLYSYYLHNTKYDNNNFFRESGYDNDIVNGYLTHWPEVIFSGDEVIFRSNSCSGVVYSVSFDDGSHWYVSNLNYDSIFTKYFGSPSEFDIVLKLTHSSGIINKSYITKVNDFNQFSINYDVDFSAGSKKDGYLDIVTDFTPALPIILGIDMTPVEYGYEGDLTELKSFYLLRPVEFVWGGALGSGIVSRSVEFCFDIVMDSWFNDVYVDFWLGELGQGYYINMFTDFVIESKNDFYENIGIDFILSNWKYFPHHSVVICSVIGCNNKNVEVSTGDGTLMRFISDVKVSDMLYADFNSSVFCSVSGISPYYLFDVQVISGTLASYGSDVYCSLLDMNNCNFEVKLNTIVIENFNMDVDDFIIGGFCFSIDIYDKHYGVTTSGINVYMNTNTLVGNAVTGLQFGTISGSGGYSVSWCYDVSSLGSLEYVEIIVRAVNTVGDINLASYFLKYGKRYYYNLYHILKHDYEKLIPMLMVAENNVDIFPSFSAESMYVRVERYKRKDLTASIFGVGLDRSDLPASINALTTNFYNGGSYKVRIECRDLSGNIMDLFEFEFTIKSDGT